MAPYVSHPVRRIRADPVADETVRLVVTANTDAADDAVASAAESLGGSIVATLQFDALLLEVSQTAVDDVCTLEGVARVETANTLSLRSNVADRPPVDDGSSADE